MSLSGGEAVRVSLRWAFLRGAPILVLDEPTSALDVHMEAAIVEVMERLMAGRTTLVISHRREMLVGCDLHLSLRDGRATAQSILAADAAASTPAG